MGPLGLDAGPLGRGAGIYALMALLCLDDPDALWPEHPDPRGTHAGSAGPDLTARGQHLVGGQGPLGQQGQGALSRMPLDEGQGGDAAGIGAALAPARIPRCPGPAGFSSIWHGVASLRLGLPARGGADGIRASGRVEVLLFSSLEGDPG